jgi:hypothetical protein
VRREEAVAGGAALARREEAAGGEAPARREEVAVGGTLARCGALTEEPDALRGAPVVPLVSEAAAGQQVYLQAAAQQPEHAGPVVAAF